jgi:TonB-linked SusC/RagA family outer membrane protein
MGLPLHLLFHKSFFGKLYQRLLMLSLCFLLSAGLNAQLISLNVKEVPLTQVLKEIEKQTDYRFVYSNTVIERSRPVTLSVSQEQLAKVLKLCFTNQPFTYEMDGKFVVLKITDSTRENPAGSTMLTGRIISDRGDELAGVTVHLKGTSYSVMTDQKGLFSIDNSAGAETIVVSGAEFAPQETAILGRSFIEIMIVPQVGILDETIVKGYYKTSRRLNIGTVDKVGEKTISEQAVSNPLAALQGRVPGLMITQNSGLPGADFSILLRGQNSLQRGTEPLFVVDGVPFNTERQTQRSITSTNNPFNIINPLDIESIEVLKDAEATAIYGSRGANGVILITTRKGDSGKTRVELNLSSGFGKAQNLTEFMNTAEFIAMRREAFRNDGITPTASNARDLLLWDTTRYTNWKQVLTGGTAHFDKVYGKLSGGNRQTSYSFAATYYNESSVAPKRVGDRRISFNTNLLHRSADKKLTVEITTLYSFSETILGVGDVTGSISLTPNAPKLYDSLGLLNWHEKNGQFTNPLSILLKRYETRTDWMNSNFSIAYEVARGLIAKVSGGVNLQLLDELSLNPIASQSPAGNPRGGAGFGNASNKNWIIEPQLEYRKDLFAHTKLVAQVGGSYQTKKTSRRMIDTYGYTSDALIRSISGATTVTAENFLSEYKYVGIFGRMTLNTHNKYLLSFTGRRDGSSRFGEDNRFANFGAAALGWIFSEEGFIKRNLRILSYGKIRTSYGSSGNDQIGDYMYLDTWSATQYLYNGSPALQPTRLKNDAYHWEMKTNFEAALETGFFENRLLFNAAYFRSISKDQLVNYSLPGQTGFASILMNFPAVIQNTGMELSANVKMLDKKNFKWSAGINLTINRNKLLEFPDLENTSYATRYQLGKPISQFRGYAFEGVNPATGVYQFKDLNNDGVVGTADQYFIGTMNPSFFGGIQQDLTYKNFELGFFFHFVKQKGNDVLAGIFAGNTVNVPIELLDRWTKPGDQAKYQKYSTNIAALNAATRRASSDAGITDASYIKLRNVNLSYRVPVKMVRRLHAESCRLFIQGQNLATITSYKGGDPETQRLTLLPPLRVFNIGLSVIF